MPSKAAPAANAATAAWSVGDLAAADLGRNRSESSAGVRIGACARTGSGACSGGALPVMGLAAAGGAEPAAAGARAVRPGVAAGAGAPQTCEKAIPGGGWGPAA